MLAPLASGQLCNEVLHRLWVGVKVWRCGVITVSALGSDVVLSPGKAGVEWVVKCLCVYCHVGWM